MLKQRFSAFLRFWVVFQNSIPLTGTPTPSLYIPGTYFVESQCTASSDQSSYIQLSSAAHTAPCGAVPFVLRCGAVPCCAVLPFEYTSSTRHYHTCCVRLFVFSWYIWSLSVPHVSPHAYDTRTADQNVTPPTSTQQHNTSQWQLALHKQLFAVPIKFVVSTKPWASSFRPLYISYI